jgi:hypothetical protein
MMQNNLGNNSFEKSASTGDMNSFECLDLFNESTDFAALIPDDEYDVSLEVTLGAIQNKSTSTLDAIQETIQICEDLENDFGFSWSSIHDTFDNDYEGGCTVVSGGSDDQSSAEADMDAVMLKLNACMKRSAETRAHVEQIAESLKKMVASSSTSVVVTVQRPAKVDSFKTYYTNGAVHKRQLPNLKKTAKVVKKRKDFAVTGCLVRPVTLGGKITAVPCRRPLVAAGTTQHIMKHGASVNSTSQKGTTSISDFLRQAKRSVPIC